MISDPVILHFADGTTKEIRGRGHFLLDLFCAACGGADLNPVQAAQLDLIRESVAAKEPGGGRMTELIQSLLQSRAAADLDFDKDMSCDLDG